MRTLTGNGRPWMPHRGMLLVGLILLAAVTLLAAAAAGEGPGLGDAGDDLDSATGIEPGAWTGSIFRNSTDEDLADFYEFPIQPGALVEARALLGGMSSTHLDVNFRVFDLLGDQVVSLPFARLGGEETFATLTRGGLDEPSYYLAITWDGSSLLEYSINYTLVVNQSAWTQDDAGAGTDAPSGMEDAPSLTAGTYRGSVGGSDAGWDPDANADGVDMYTVMPEVGHFLKVTVTLDERSDVRNQNLVMSLKNSTGKVLDQVIVTTEGGRATVRYLVNVVEGLYINISSTALLNNYSLSISFEVPGADGGGMADAGNDLEHARELVDASFAGVIMRGNGAEDPSDFYELGFASSQFVEASFTLRSGTASPSKVRVSIFDHTKSEVVNFTMQGLDQPVRFASLTNSRYTTLRYYFSITWVGEPEVPFEFRYELATDVRGDQDDGGSGEDVSNSSSGSLTLSFDTPLSGTVGGTNPQWSNDLNADGADAYEVLPVSGRFVVVRAILDGFEGQRREGFDVHLEDQSGTLLVKPRSLFAVGDETTFQYYAPDPTPVYVVVTSESESCDYTILVSLEDPPVVDLLVESITVTPSQPLPGTEATITVVVSSTQVIETSTVIRVEVFVSGNKLAERDVVFDGTDKVVVDLTWMVPSASIDLSVSVDTLNAIPWETNEDNNGGSLHVVVGDGGAGGDGDDEVTDLMFWTFVLVGVIALAILVVVLYVVFGGHGAEDEEPEDY